MTCLMSRAPHDTGVGRKTTVLMSVASGQEACLQGSDDKCPVLGTCRDMSQDIYNLVDLSPLFAPRLSGYRLIQAIHVS